MLRGIFKKGLLRFRWDGDQFPNLFDGCAAMEHRQQGDRLDSRWGSAPEGGATRMAVLFKPDDAHYVLEVTATKLKHPTGVVATDNAFRRTSAILRPTTRNGARRGWIA